MSPRGRFRRAEREELGGLRYLFGDAVTGDEEHGKINGPKVYKHERRTAH